VQGAEPQDRFETEVHQACEAGGSGTKDEKKNSDSSFIRYPAVARSAG
jgi:hypothetical protein